MRASRAGNRIALAGCSENKGSGQPELGAGKKFLEKKEINFSAPLKPEFQGFKADSNIVVNCWVKFKSKSEEILLPYSIVNASGEMQSYFYTIEKDKVVLFCYNSGSSLSLPMESLSLNFTKIQ